MKKSLRISFCWIRNCCMESLSISEQKEAWLFSKLSSQLNLIISLSSKEHQNAPFISSSIVHTKASLGDSATLRCKVEVPFGQLEIKWFKDGHELMLNEKFRSDLNQDGEITLNIFPVNAEDEGYYTCQLTNEFGHCVCEAPLIIDGKLRQRKQCHNTFKLIFLIEKKYNDMHVVMLQHRSYCMKLYL